MKSLFKIAALTASVVLASCGGGGSDGGSTPSAESQIPTSFATSVAENSGPVFRNITTFPFIFASPSDTISGAGLTGPDAAFFRVNILVTSVSATRVNVTLELETLQGFDFEAPIDANGNNVYDFTLSVQYNAQTISRPVSITVTDVSEPVVVQAKSFSGEFSGQSFGERATPAADITNDGLPEIAVSIVSNAGERSNYVIASNTYADGLVGPTNIGAGSNVGSFVQIPLDFASGDLFSAPPGFRRYNLLTAEASASGADVLVSESAPKQLTLFRAQNAASQPLLTPAADTQTSALAKIDYTIDALGFQVEARMIGDVNGDGANDIFAHFIRENVLPSSGGEPFYRQKFGIVFGETGGASAATITSTGLDIELIYPDDLEGTRGEVFVKALPDMTGDGRPEYLIAHPEYGAVEDEFDFVNARGAVYLIRSEALNVASGTIIDLAALAAAEGVAFDATAESPSDPNRLGRSLSLLADYDSDGFPTLLFTDDQFRLYAIDADDFLAMPSQSVTADFLSAGGVVLTPNGGTFAPVFPADAGDVDENGVADFMSPAEFGQDFLFFDGSIIANALATGGGSTIGTGAPIFTVDFSDFGNANTFSRSAPLFVPQANLYAVGFLGDADGTLVIIDRADVVDAATNSGFDTMSVTR